MPGVNYFKPQGIPLKSLEEVILTVSEYEALNLCDLQGLTQKQASEKMQVSQPTFNRILSSARTKVSKAIINGYAIKITGGKYKLKDQSLQ